MYSGRVVDNDLIIVSCKVCRRVQSGESFVLGFDASNRCIMMEVPMRLWCFRALFLPSPSGVELVVATGPPVLSLLTRTRNGQKVWEKQVGEMEKVVTQVDDTLGNIHQE